MILANIPMSTILVKHRALDTPHVQWPGAIAILLQRHFNASRCLIFYTSYKRTKHIYSLSPLLFYFKKPAFTYSLYSWFFETKVQLFLSESQINLICLLQSFCTYFRCVSVQKVLDILVPSILLKRSAKTINWSSIPLSIVLGIFCNALYRHLPVWNTIKDHFVLKIKHNRFSSQENTHLIYSNSFFLLQNFLVAMVWVSICNQKCITKSLFIYCIAGSVV